MGAACAPPIRSTPTSLTWTSATRSSSLPVTNRSVPGLPFPCLLLQATTCLEGLISTTAPAAILHAGANRGWRRPDSGGGDDLLLRAELPGGARRPGARCGGEPDAHLFQFGEHILQKPLADSNPKSSLALSNVMNNFTRNDHATNQGGQTRFVFRYRLGCGSGSLAAHAALRLPVRSPGRLLRPGWLR